MDSLGFARLSTRGGGGSGESFFGTTNFNDGGLLRPIDELVGGDLMLEVDVLTGAGIFVSFLSPTFSLSFDVLFPIMGSWEGWIRFRDIASRSVFFGGGGGATGEAGSGDFCHSGLLDTLAFARSSFVAPLEEKSLRSFGLGSASVGDLRRLISLYVEGVLGNESLKADVCDEAGLFDGETSGDDVGDEPSGDGGG